MLLPIFTTIFREIISFILVYVKCSIHWVGAHFCWKSVLEPYFLYPAIQYNARDRFVTVYLGNVRIAIKWLGQEASKWQKIFLSIKQDDHVTESPCLCHIKETAFCKRLLSIFDIKRQMYYSNVEPRYVNSLWWFSFLCRQIRIKHVLTSYLMLSTSSWYTVFRQLLRKRWISCFISNTLRYFFFLFLHCKL